jgi:hypothetical protein
MRKLKMLILLGCSIQLQAQLKFRVLDSVSRVPIENVFVSVKANGLIRTVGYSDINGNVKADSVHVDQSIRLDHVAYETKFMNVNDTLIYLQLKNAFLAPVHIRSCISYSATYRNYSRYRRNDVGMIATNNVLIATVINIADKNKPYRLESLKLFLYHKNKLQEKQALTIYLFRVKNNYPTTEEIIQPILVAAEPSDKALIVTLPNSELLTDTSVCIAVQFQPIFSKPDRITGVYWQFRRGDDTESNNWNLYKGTWYQDKMQSITPYAELSVKYCR